MAIRLMKFTVKPEDQESFELNERTLFDLLSKEVMKKERNDFLHMSNVFNGLSKNNKLV